MDIHELAKKYEDYMISIRREFHMHPELSLQEERTSRRIQEELKAMGIPYEVVGNRNVVGKIEFANPGRKVAFRADIDALPMQEEIESEFKSTVPGVMHACGHDVHAATLLAAAKCMMDMKDELYGTAYLCFQVAEEVSGRGPEEIVEYLESIGGVDEVVGNHIAGPLPVGVGAVRPLASNAGNCQWRITVHGRGGHGSRPDQSIDPIRPAAQILTRIVAIPANYHSPFDTLVISPCMIHAGTAYNVIPDDCYIEGNLRYFKVEDLDKVLALMEKIASNISESYGATAELTKIASCPPVVNDKDVTDRCIKAMEKAGLKVVIPQDPGMGSDDFAVYQLTYPGCYVNIGAKSDRPGASPVHHNTKFFLDEKGFLPVVEFFVNYAAEQMK
jgi:carboxypeptidase Ss1